MPLYEYQCEQCGNRFEKIQKFSDPPIEVCPKCGGRVDKLLSSPAIQFKGSGWYVTDYARKNTANGGKSEPAAKKDDAKPAPDSSASASPSTTSSDTSKPAAKDS